MEAKSSPLDEQRKTIRKLAAGQFGETLADPSEPPRTQGQVYVDSLPDSFKVKSPYTSLAADIRTRCAAQWEAQAILAAERKAKEQADAQAALLPRPKTPEEKLRDEQIAAYNRRCQHALGFDVNRKPVVGFPEAPPPA